MSMEVIMKKNIAILLVIIMIFSLSACGGDSNFSKLQGKWYCYDHGSIEHYIRISGDQLYMRIGTSAEQSHGNGLVKQGRNIYVSFVDARLPISISEDGTEIKYQSCTFKK